MKLNKPKKAEVLDTFIMYVGLVFFVSTIVYNIITHS